ncbi:rRNA-processing protein FCF1 [Dictyocoela muelleri]|nr:rRNA-processing protein FCF1 [Dictyocoela muelleri]
MSRYFKPRKLINRKKKSVQPKEQELINEDPLQTIEYRLNNTLRPPYNILLDTNFIAQSIQRKMDIKTELLRVLNSNFKIWIPQCVFSELSKLKNKDKISISVIKMIDHEVLICDHKGDYADDCLYDRVNVHRCYVLATCDTGLKQRVRKISGVPLMYIRGHKYEVEGLIV